MATKLTIFTLGPLKSGKTSISNYLAELSGSLGGSGENREYHPTQGVRILEFDRTITTGNGKKVDIEVELWDCSGDPRFHPTWPTLLPTASALLLIIPPETPSTSLSHLTPLLTNLPTLILSHTPSPTSKLARYRPLPDSPLSKHNIVPTCLDANPEVIRNEFEGLLRAGWEVGVERSRKVEDSIVG